LCQIQNALSRNGGIKLPEVDIQAGANNDLSQRDKSVFTAQNICKEFYIIERNLQEKIE